MSSRIRFELDIDAPHDLVWRVITDLPRYAEWNPFVVRAKSSLEVGQPILMRVKVLPLFAQAQRETILECRPGERLCWGLAGSSTSPLRSRRCQKVHATVQARTRYVSDFELAGWLAPLVMGLLGGRLRAGFRAMSEAVKERAELLQRQRA